MKTSFPDEYKKLNIQDPKHATVSKEGPKITDQIVLHFEYIHIINLPTP